MAKLYSIYRHKKTGHIVRVIELARLQTQWPTTHLDDMDIMVVYVHAGNTWVRAEREFDDGRFEVVT